MITNKKFHKAKNAKNDEFYTLLPHIEKELRHYRAHLKGKTIFLNCDDPLESNFWKYFSLNFKFFGLKKLIATHFNPNKATYKLEILRDINGDGKIDHLDTVKTDLQQNGDFRSPEAVALMEEADIVVTNPPFSLFREYVAQLIEYKKDFIIVGPINAVTTKEIFPLIKNGQTWLGLNVMREFGQPNGLKNKAVYACWYTNLDHMKRAQDLFLHREYSPEKYPEYDDYAVINVNKTTDIPTDYYGPMGVPITFLHKHNPDQFEILGLDDHRLQYPAWRGRGPNLDGKPKYRRIIIQRKPS